MVKFRISNFEQFEVFTFEGSRPSPLHCQQRLLRRESVMLWTPRGTAPIRIRQCIRRQIEPFRQRRFLHKVLTLPYAEFKPEENGIYPLYSKEGFAMAWTQKQTDLINTVNRITTGTAIAHEELFNLIVLTYKQPQMAPLFNAASSAWNNAFFFTGIHPQSRGVSEPVIPILLKTKINDDFGSVLALRNLIFQTAMAIHGSGWVWMVVGPMGNLRVLATFNAGSPFDLTSRQPTDPNTNLNVDIGLGPLSGPGPGARPNRKQEYLLLPVLGLNCWEHAYVTDYGCSLDGKREYLKNWWATINWRRVHDAMKRRQESLVAPRNVQ